jgi:hypothetical protein
VLTVVGLKMSSVPALVLKPPKNNFVVFRDPMWKKTSPYVVNFKGLSVDKVLMVNKVQRKCQEMFQQPCSHIEMLKEKTRTACQTAFVSFFKKRKALNHQNLNSLFWASLKPTVACK